MWHHPVFQGVLLKFFFSCQTWGHQVLLVLSPRFPTFQLSVLVSKTQNSHHLVKLQSSANGAPSKTRDILRGYTPTFITSSCDPRWDVQICPTKCQTFDISNTKSQLRSRSPKQHPNTYSRTVPRIIHFTEFRHFDWVFLFELRRERSLLSCPDTAMRIFQNDELSRWRQQGFHEKKLPYFMVYMSHSYSTNRWQRRKKAKNVSGEHRKTNFIRGSRPEFIPQWITRSGPRARLPFHCTFPS